LPGPTTGRLCPICDSPIEKGAKKCSFCGTDLTIFGSESEGAQQQEERLVKDSQPAVETKAPTPAYAPSAAQAAPAKPAAPPAPKVEPAAQAAEEALFQCPNCNGMVKESDTVCPHCGAMFVEDETAQFECPACGTLVNADATTCSGCGAIFVEDEAAATEATPAAAQEAPKQAAPAAQPAIPGEEEVVLVSEGTKGEEAEDADVHRIVSQIKEERGQEVGAVKKVKKPGIGGILRGGKREEAPAKRIVQPSAGPAAAGAPRPAAAPALAISLPPMTKRQIPTDPKDQGRELAKLVNDVRSLLNIATEKGIIMDESKDLLDRAIAAGRERQLNQALTMVINAEEKLNTRLRDYVVASFSSLQEEMAVAARLGGNTAKGEVFSKEAKRAAETPDYQAAFVFIDKAKAELAPITGKYNTVRDLIRKYERLVRDSRAVGIDNEPLKDTLEEAKRAFEVLNFEKAESIARGSTGEIMSQVKDRIGPEIDKAKQMLVEVKMKAESGVGPQITILKSAIKAYKEENYLEALAEIKRFKKEMKKLLTPT